jgi:hypothetical protein
MNDHPGSAGAAVLSKESEEQLVERAQSAISLCRWTIGECAGHWTKRFARGRTDADFATMIGLTVDQVYQRRRVWETFNGERDKFPSLKWSHFYSALAWDDSLDCLQWAEENKSTVAEMKAWRRAVRGEDLTLDADAIPLPEGVVQFVPNETSFVQDPSGYGAAGSRGAGGSRGGDGDESEVAGTLSGAARQTMAEGGAGYSPYRADAGSVPSKGESSPKVTPPEPVPPDQMVKRMTATLERCLKVFTPEFRREFRKLPEPLRNKFVKAVGELSSTVGNLM